MSRYGSADCVRTLPLIAPQLKPCGFPPCGPFPPSFAASAKIGSMEARVKLEEEKATRKPLTPDWKHEYELHARGYSLLAGVDEVGRGAWAGPLVAAAVIFPHPDAFAPGECPQEVTEELDRLRDSKMLSAAVREELISAVYASALAVGVGMVSPALIDVIGLGAANRLAMVRAVRDLGIWTDHLLLDAFRLPQMPI